MSLKDALHLAEWFRENERPLPWRNTGNAYDVWISEIMLQQTRIEAVIEKYMQFRSVLKDIPTLAACDEDTLMRLWEGLGYYNRARNLQKCARIVTEKYGGQLPKEKEALLALPGIGPYTCGAILSIAYGIGEPAIDGNVLRVFARYFKDERNVLEKPIQKDTEQCIRQIYIKENSPEFVRDFTQSLMELGETVCLPNTQPLCSGCPLQKNCKAHETNAEMQLPVRVKNTKRKVVERTLCIIKNNATFLVHKRPSEGLLANLYEFYGIERKCTKQEVERLMEEKGFSVTSVTPLPSSRHLFSHIQWNMTAYEVEVNSLLHDLGDSYSFVSRKALQSLAIPSAFRKYVDYYHLRKEA